MAFEYNGFIHRDLEPQVRYDAEQVQLLKQADVTINENLQTINTEINGKLTKPTNPSAESAVTMLADGTVGTKPLSEIGGGGGKLYRHDIRVETNDFGIYFNTFSSYPTAYTQYTFPKNPDIYYTASIRGLIQGVLSIIVTGNETSCNISYTGVIYHQGEQAIKYIDNSISSDSGGGMNVFNDTVTEL